MTLIPGQKIGSYEITAEIGSGGMGQVYRARDPGLEREVAIKVLPDAVSADAERVKRFEREAKLLAALSHGNVATLYGFERDGERRFLVMELVEGEDLAQRLARGPIPLAEAVPLFLQIAQGLEAAHARGVIHRDLKPANVKVESSGVVKLLDFGLAKATAQSGAGGAGQSDSPTLTVAATRQGQILGTAAYMAPEQAAGREVDARADVWAFGACLYEALTGSSPFAAPSHAETLARVLEGAPDWDALPASTPAAVVRLLRRCLRKDPRDRLHHIADARLELAELGEPSPGPPASAERPKRSLAAAGLVAGVVVGVLVGLAWPRSPASVSDPASSLSRHYDVRLPAEALLPFGSVAPPIGFDSPAVALSPDGKTLVYVGMHGATTALYVREIDSFDVRRLEGTDGAHFAFFSPEGRRIGFLTEEKVQKVSLEGGSPIALCETNTPARASWAEDDTIYFSDVAGHNLSRVPASGGKPTPIIVNIPGQLPPSRFASFSQMLPDSPWALVTVWQRSMSGDYASIVAFSVETLETRTIVPYGYDARWVESGHLVFVRGSSLLAVPFDRHTLEARGDPVAVLDGVSSESLFGQGQFDIARSGTLAYLPGTDAAIGRPAWVDREGETEVLAVPSRVFGVASVSPDGRQLAIGVADLEDYVLLVDLETMEERRFAIGGSPVWSRSGRELTYTYVDDAGRWTIARQALDHSRSPEILLTRPFWLNAVSWSADDTVLGLTEVGYEEGFRMGFVTAGAEPRYEPVEEIQTFYPTFSPDGTMVAFGSDASGRYEVWLRTEDGRRRQISTGGGNELRWSANGELFWRNGNRFHVTRVLDEGLATTPPQLVFDTDFVDTQGNSFDVSPDGRRLLVVKETGEREVEAIRIVEHWSDELDARWR